MEEKEIKKILDNGGVLAQVSFEVIGTPKEHVEKSMKSYIENVKKDEQIHFITEDTADPEELDNKMWATYSDNEMLFENIQKLTWLCFNFMPSNIDIIAPENLKFKEKEFTNWLNDLISKLHEVSTEYRQTSSNEQALKRSLNTLIHNSILLACDKPRIAEDISKRIGIAEEQLMPFFDSLIKNNKLEKKGDEFVRK
jgi:hypothetical protein